jgi:hypothetical protein
MDVIRVKGAGDAGPSAKKHRTVPAHARTQSVAARGTVGATLETEIGQADERRDCLVKIDLTNDFVGAFEVSLERTLARESVLPPSPCSN